MFLTNTALQQLQRRLPKVISPTTHGIIDYCHATFFAAMAIVCWKRNKPAALAAASTSALVLTQSLFTDYKLGLKPVLPFSVHGQMDGVFAASSLGIPRLFGFQDTKADRIFQINAFVEATVVGLTDWSDERARAEENPSS